MRKTPTPAHKRPEDMSVIRTCYTLCSERSRADDPQPVQAIYLAYNTLCDNTSSPFVRARQVVGSAAAQLPSDQWGALAYLAPEAAKGTAGKASDVYSFGVMLWEMAAGVRPYLGLTTPQVGADALHTFTVPQGPFG